MVKTKKDFLNPVSRQNFANTFAVTHNLNLELCLKGIIPVNRDGLGARLQWKLKFKWAFACVKGVKACRDALCYLCTAKMVIWKICSNQPEKIVPQSASLSAMPK